MHKRCRGFTLIELVIVIAVLGIIAGIAIPRFLDAQETARGAKLLADLRSIESTAAMYGVKNGTMPSRIDPNDKQYPVSAMVPDYLAVWPIAPMGIVKVTGYDGKEYRYQMGQNSSNKPITYAWNGPTRNDAGIGRATIGRWTIDNLLTNKKPTGNSYITQLTK